MTKRPTPSPYPEPRIGCFLVTLFLAVIGMAFSAASKKGIKFWNVIFAVPLIIIIVQFLYEKGLLVTAKHKTDLYSIHGVLVMSDSANWKQYIEDIWLPKIGNFMQMLNWSEHKKWRRSIYTMLFYRFVGTNENYCPSVVLLRGLKQPLVFRFFYAFRDAKHGNRLELSKLEQRLFEELDNIKMGT
jgi:hypothetical protein